MAQTPNKVKKKLNFYAKLPPKVSNDTFSQIIYAHRNKFK